MAEFTSEQLQRIKTLDEGNVSVAGYKKILKQVESAAELHTIALGYNRDNGTDLLLQIVNHTACDKGTALEIYWLGKPDFFSGYKYKKDVPKYSQEGFSFLKKLEKLYLKDQFSSNDIEYDPRVASHSEAEWQCLVKYSGVKDELLISNSGDQQKSLKSLDVIRTKPDDLSNPETLRFFATTYYKNLNQYKNAYNSAQRLYMLDNSDSLYQSIYESVIRDVEQELSSNHPHAGEIFTDIEKRDFYIEFIQIQEEELKTLEKDKARDEDLRYFRRSIAKLHVSIKNYPAAIEILTDLLESAQNDEAPKHEVLGFNVDLANIYQEIGDFDSAKLSVDEILSDYDETSGLFFHRYKLLSKMGESEEAEALLDRRLDVIDNDRIAAEKAGKPESGYYRDKATILEDYKQDFIGAASALQQVIDQNLFRDARDKKELLNSIHLLEQGKASQEPN